MGANDTRARDQAECPGPQLSFQGFQSLSPALHWYTSEVISTRLATLRGHCVSVLGGQSHKIVRTVPRHDCSSAVIAPQGGILLRKKPEGLKEPNY